MSSNLTNKYNPQELTYGQRLRQSRSNLTNKYNPQERIDGMTDFYMGSNLTNKYNPQEHGFKELVGGAVQILPINTILKNC